MFGRKKIVRLVGGCCLALGCLVNTAGAKPAAPGDKPEVEKPAEKGYVVAYALVGLGVVLGLLGICRPRNRDIAPTFKQEDQ